MTDDVSKTIVIVGMMLIFVIDSVGDKIIKAIREKNSEEKNK